MGSYDGYQKATDLMTIRSKNAIVFVYVNSNYFFNAFEISHCLHEISNSLISLTLLSNK